MPWGSTSPYERSTKQEQSDSLGLDLEVAVSEFDVVGTGFTVLDRIYADACDVAAEELGGSCGNVLISLAMLNRNVAPVLSLGSDEVGGRLVGEFRHAGAETRFIRRRANGNSPVLTQHLDSLSGSHSFAFRCPQTDEELPRYEPIQQEDVERALPIITSCALFYTDRLSHAIVEAMETAAGAGAIVYFEPSDVTDEELFWRAIAVTAVLKFSADRLAETAGQVELPERTVSIVTYGEAGLEVCQGGTRLWCHSHPAPALRDTCGSGDMVSVGVIDRILARRASLHPGIDLSDLILGVKAGQRLAAENCAYIGARGLFVEKGAEYARGVLQGPG
jgi:fructokinase